MKKILFLLSISTLIYAKINTIVSILPQKTFVEKIAGDKANITLMVAPGQSPHTYDPKPSQMKAISNAQVYFKIGIEFEKEWLVKFKDANKKMQIVDSAKGIKKIPLSEHFHEGEEHNENEGTLDPHIWLSPDTVAVIAKNIYETFISIDSKNKDYYTANYKKFLQEIEQTDKQINDILLKTDDMAKFLVFHPSWGYFAKQYRLTQVAIESGGKKPKAKRIKKIIQETKKDYFNVIITSPEFSDKSAKVIANQSGIKVIKVSPLSADWSNNLIHMAKAIAN